MNILKKFTSRKFLTAILGTVIGIAMAFGYDASELTRFSGAICSAISIATYIFTEGRVDAAAVNKAKDAVNTIQEVMSDADQNESGKSC